MKARITAPIVVLFCVLVSTAHVYADDAAVTVGWRHIKRGDYEAALTALEPTLRRLSSTPGQEKELARAHLGVGMACLLGLKQEKAARAHFREALRRDLGLSLPNGLSRRAGQLVDQAREYVVRLHQDETWAAAKQAAATGAPLSERVQSLEQTVTQLGSNSPHHAEAVELLRQLRDEAARALAQTPPDLANLGTVRHAKYSGGTIRGLEPGAPIDLSFAEKQRLLFLPKGGGFVAMLYGRILRLEYGLTTKLAKKKSHYLTIQYQDASNERLAAVLELRKDDFRPVLELLEARTGVTVEYQDEKAAQERWK